MRRFLVIFVSPWAAIVLRLGEEGQMMRHAIVLLCLVHAVSGCAGPSVTFFPWNREISSAAVTVPMPRGCGPAVLKIPLREKPRGAIRGVVVVGDDPRGFEVGK